MGVKGLWSIVSPVGIRVNPEIFAGKRIAIDVSIWLYELTYANNLKIFKDNSFDNLSVFNDLWIDFSQNMSNEIRTNNLKKKHLYFFFLRICKLLYYNIKPIFIFDGNPPELKKKTIFQRNLKKINYEEKFKKTAEKIIYNYYQNMLLKSMKNKRNISSNKKKNNEKNILYKSDVSNLSMNNSLEISDNMVNDASLNDIVETVGNVNISLKDVLNFCNDDLHKIENNILMLTNTSSINEENNKNGEIIKNKLVSDKIKEKNNSITNNYDNTNKKYMSYDEYGNEVKLIDDEKEESIIKNHNLNIIDNEINEEIIRKKHIARKKYYENIPEKFRGFLSMRRPVDIIDIDNYNTDILEYTKKLKETEEKYNKMYSDNIVLKKNFNLLDDNNIISKKRDEQENLSIYSDKDSYTDDKNSIVKKSLDVEYVSSSDEYFSLSEKKKKVNITDNDKKNKNNNDICDDVSVNKKDINILELPSNTTSSNIFLEGKDEYKVYHINNEEIKIPLFKELNKDVFDKLPIQLQYQILQDIKEEWYADNRIKAIKSKDDMNIFSQVQLETYVRMIKTDFEIEKLKIRMAENIQNVEGELVVNKELSKNFENLNIRDYNDIKKRRRRRKKYINDILNNFYFNDKSNISDLIIKSEDEGEEKEKEKERINNIKDDYNNNKEIYENIIIKNDKIKNIKYEEEKKMLEKLENDFKKDLLMDDEQIFGDNFFHSTNEECNSGLNNINDLDILNGKYQANFQSVNIGSNDTYEINKKGSDTHSGINFKVEEGITDNIKKREIINENNKVKNIAMSEKNEIFNKKTNENNEIINRVARAKNEILNENKNENKEIKYEKANNVSKNLGKININEMCTEEKDKNEKSSFSSDDFEDCIVEEKKDIDELLREDKNTVIDLTRRNEVSEEHEQHKPDDNLTSYISYESMNNFDSALYHTSNDEPDVKKTNKLESVSDTKDKSTVEVKNLNTNNDILNQKRKINEDIHLIKKKEESIEKNIPFELDKTNEIKEPLSHEKPCGGTSVCLKENTDNAGDMDSCYNLMDEIKNASSIDGDKNMHSHNNRNTLVMDDKKIDNKIKIKKNGNINKIISKQKINNILLNKCDLNSIGKENFFEKLLDNKEMMDQFNVEVKEKEKLKEDGNEEYAFYEYLEDSKVIDSYINETKKENEELIKEFKKIRKNNIEINDEMNDDIKVLLDFFGIPYIQSPCEAEAQCSYLNSKNYCDAIISNDSDVLVFSGKTIIKNFFDKKKTVEVYEKKIIEDKLGLYQEELINISLLCGCDYTIGVHGIGIVNALEIIKAFPTFEDLKKLKEIVSNPFKEINTDNYSEEIKIFLNTHKNYKLNWIFPNNFPDREVYNCFKYPKVCTNIKKFQWYFPNINSISKFLNKTTNIPEEKIFNVLDPILQKYDIKVGSYQLKIEDFFPVIEKKRKGIDNLIKTIRKNKKGKQKDNKNIELNNKNKKKDNADIELDKNISSLIDVNPAGIIKSKRMATALDCIKSRKSKKIK